MQQYVVDAPFERLGIREVADPDRPAPDFVFIGRADAATGRAELLVATPFLAGAVERAVGGQNQCGVVGELQILWVDIDALRADRVDLLDQRPRIDDHPAANYRQLAWPHHP